MSEEQEQQEKTLEQEYADSIQRLDELLSVFSVGDAKFMLIQIWAQAKASQLTAKEMMHESFEHSGHFGTLIGDESE